MTLKISNILLGVSATDAANISKTIGHDTKTKELTYNTQRF